MFRSAFSALINACCLGKQTLPHISTIPFFSFLILHTAKSFYKREKIEEINLVVVVETVDLWKGKKNAQNKPLFHKKQLRKTRVAFCEKVKNKNFNEKLVEKSVESV